MTVDLKIKNARIFWHGTLIDGGLCIDNGKIKAIAKDSNLTQADFTVDAKRMLCLPGLVDIHVHLRDLELSYKEDFISGTSAAAAGGFTTVVDMPNTKPTTDSESLLEEKIRIASSRILVRVGFNVVPSNLNQMDKTKNKALGFKFNLVKQWSDLTMDEKTISSIIRRSGALGKMVSFHAEDEKTVNELETKFKNEESIESYYKAHPPKAEEESVRKILSCATRSSHVHFCHISTLEALSAIKKARMSGMHVSCEVTPHHTLLDVESAIDKGGISIMDPPLRNRTVSETLFQAVRTGEVEVVASDHAPHSVKEKVNSHWWDIPPGIPGLETTLPLFLTQVNKGRISLDRVVQVLSTEPMKLLSLDARGIEQGASGDLVLVDTKREAKIDSSKFLSKAKYSPFDGVQAIGWPVMTFVSGQLVYDDGEITSKPGSGHVLIPTQLKSTLDPR